MLLCVFISVVLTAAYLMFQEPILTLFGGRVNGETFHHAKEYFFYITVGIPFYMFGQAMNPIFIYIFRWGMMGAAVATVASQVLTAVLAVWYLRRMKAVQLERASFRLHSSIAAQYLPLGICSFLSQFSLVVSMAAVQNMCTKYDALDPVFGQAEYSHIPLAVLGIVMKFFQIVISTSVGMAAGCIPVVGYNIGAGRSDRAKALFTRLLAAEAIVGAVALVS